MPNVAPVPCFCPSAGSWAGAKAGRESLSPAPTPRLRRSRDGVASVAPRPGARARQHARMSVSTPEPPPARPHVPAERPEREPGVPVELRSAEEFEAAMRQYEHATYVSVGGAGGGGSGVGPGAVRERPFLVVVEAYAKSCRACIGMRRAYEKCAEQHKADAAFFMFDAHAVPRLAQTLGIRSLPTFILFKGGARIDHFNASCRDSLEQNINDNL